MPRTVLPTIFWFRKFVTVDGVVTVVRLGLVRGVKFEVSRGGSRQDRFGIRAGAGHAEVPVMESIGYCRGIC